MDALTSIFTGYPWFRLRAEGLPRSKVKTLPWLQAPFMARKSRPLISSPKLDRNWAWHSAQFLDWYAKQRLPECDAVVSLSSTGLGVGAKAKRNGYRFVCDRGSSHISFQDDLLREEHALWNLEWQGVDPRIIDKELQEYELADIVTVPSEFVYNSFVSSGYAPERLRKIPYGGRLDRFQRVSKPKPDNFRVLYVGSISLRKGFLYLLQAFERLNHPRKELQVIGPMSEQVRKLLPRFTIDSVQFLGRVPNEKLPQYYSEAHAFALPSLEEGLAMVQGEALACGCPVIATDHTGGADLFDDGQEGFIVPIRSVDALAERIQLLADDPALRTRMSLAAEQRVKKIGGWDTYGHSYYEFLQELTKEVAI